MSKVFSQREIVDYLSDNPLNIPIHVGDLDNMNGENYIFLDYLGEQLIPFDNGGCYKTNIQISIYTKQFKNRKTLTDYVKGLTQLSIEYQGSNEGNYFVAILQGQVFING